MILHCCWGNHHFGWFHQFHPIKTGHSPSNAGLPPPGRRPEVAPQRPSTAGSARVGRPPESPHELGRSRKCPILQEVELHGLAGVINLEIDLSSCIAGWLISIDWDSAFNASVGGLIRCTSHRNSSNLEGWKPSLVATMHELTPHISRKHACGLCTSIDESLMVKSLVC